jgi:IS5 family transposase
MVVAANVSYPTDSGLLAKAVRRIAATGRRIQAAGGAVRTKIRDRGRSAGARAHAIAAKLRLRGVQARDEAQQTVQRVTGGSLHTLHPKIVPSRTGQPQRHTHHHTGFSAPS